MAGHRVHMTLPRSMYYGIKIGSRGPQFSAFKGETKIGMIEIQKGYVAWFDHKSEQKCRRVTWQQLAEFILKSSA